MGNVVRLYQEPGGRFPKNKRKELARRIERVFQAGGMMDVEEIVLWGVEVEAIRKARIKKGEMKFWYNYFEQSPDDMIPYWEAEGDFDFSEELWDWFSVLRERFEEIMASDLSIEDPRSLILISILETYDEYYQIYPFAEFLEETLEHIEDKRYLVLWKLYEEMLHEPKRRLIHEWRRIEDNKRNNKARVTFRRYMALVANLGLRKKVFGF
ncbi:MAG: hypothetical protein IJP31_09095 [Lachnospiraceae bacterium]|nr:hypothetical protein [Lachnospiraceae bacterium]